QPALVRSERAVELDAKAAVDVDLAAIVVPHDAKDDLPLGLADPFDDLVLRVLRVLAQNGAETRGDLAHGLVELGLSGVAADDIADDLLDSSLDARHGSSFPWLDEILRASRVSSSRSSCV